jgi:hypothetical protein
MTAEEFMQNVRHAGGEVWAAGDKLRYRLPSTATALVPAMRELKPELLQLLRPRDADRWATTFALWDAELEALYVSLRAERRQQDLLEFERLFNIQPEDETKKG